jgi:predicted nucleic acid-binding protein
MSNFVIRPFTIIISYFKAQFLVFLEVIFGINRLAELRVEIIIDGLSLTNLVEGMIDSSGLNFDDAHWVTLAKSVQILEFFTSNEKLDFAYTCVYCVWERRYHRY